MLESVLSRQRAFRAIQNDCATGNVAHCYIFCSADRLLLDAFCEAATFAVVSAGQTGETLELTRRKVRERTHADVLYYPRTAKNINRDEYDDIMSEMGYGSVEGGRRVFVLSDAQLILPNIQNRLLKTLEEPLGDYVFLLKTSTLATMLSTVLSRSRVVELGALTSDDVKEGLRRLISAQRKNKTDPEGADEGELIWAAQYADGNLTKAYELIQDPACRGMSETVWEFLSTCDSSRDLVKWVDRVAAYEKNLETLLKFFADALRDILVTATAGEEYAIARDRVKLLKNLTQRYSAESASAGIDRVQTALRQLASYVNKTSVVDSFLFGLLEDRAAHTM